MALASMHHPHPGSMSHYGGDSYEDVIRRAESLFNKIRYSVAQQVGGRLTIPSLAGLWTLRFRVLLPFVAKHTWCNIRYPT